MGFGGKGFMKSNEKITLVTENGKIVERFRLKFTALSQKHYYEKKYGQKLNVVKESDDKDLNTNK